MEQATSIIASSIGNQEKNTLDEIHGRLVAGHLCTVGAFTDGRLVGVAAIEVAPRQDSHIAFLAVDRTFRDRGVGKALMFDAEDRAYAAGSTGIKLEAIEEGPQSFFQYHGYQQPDPDIYPEKLHIDLPRNV